MNGSTNATDQSRILDFLSRVDRRLRVNEALKGLTLGLWGLSFALVLSKLTGAWDRPVAGGTLLLVYAAGAAALTAWFYSKRKGLSVPAAVADSRSDSKDALKSALDFIGLPARTAWMDFQIRRTASVADGIAPSDMAPTELPKPIFFASGLALVLAGLLSWNPQWLDDVDPASWLAAAGIAPEEATSETGAEASLPEEGQEELEELDAALERLREAELQMPETLRDLREVQDALAASRLDMEQLEMDLEKMGAELESVSGLTELAEALKAQDAQKAAELLRALAERLSDAQTSEELKALLESLKSADVQQADLKNLMEQLENARNNMSPESLAEMAQALDQAASQLESMAQEAQQMAQPLDQMGQEMQSLQASMGQQQQAAGQEAQQGQQQQAGGQAMQSASGMMSSQLQMAQFRGDPSSAVPVDAGPAGDSTGPGGGEEPVLGEATTLEVQLEMEVLAAEERNEPIPEEIFERLSREEKSTLNYEAVSQRKTYAEESVLRHERVPWSYRSLVKTYFLTIVRNAEEKSESGSQK